MCFSGIFSCFSKKRPHRVISVIVVGLDGAGKSSLLAALAGDIPNQTTPTVGFSSEVIQRGKYQIKLFDLGGGSLFRDIWERYYAEVYGVIFVVDAADQPKLEIAREVFFQTLQSSDLTNKPVLICANKHDLAGALQAEEVTQRMQLDKLTNPHHLVSTNANHRPLDSHLTNGVDWLISKINDEYDKLEPQVKRDLEVAKSVDRRNNVARQQRVSVLNEEREQEESEQKAKRKRESQQRIDQVMKERERQSSDSPAPHPLAASLPPIYELEQSDNILESRHPNLLPSPEIDSLPTFNAPTYSPTVSPSASGHSGRNTLIFSAPADFSTGSYGKKSYAPPTIALPEDLPVGTLIKPKRKNESSDEMEKSESKPLKAETDADDAVMRKQSDLPEAVELQEVSQKQFFLSTEWPIRKDVLPSIQSSASNTLVSTTSGPSTSFSPTHTSSSHLPPLHDPGRHSPNKIPPSR